MMRHGKTARLHTLEPAPQEHAPAKLCEWEGCTDSGDYRAPRSRLELNSYRWFCLSHVREYNAHWNFYEGMSESEIEADLRRDTVWQRPTWPFGKAAPGMNGHRARVRTDFAEFDEDVAHDSRRPQALEPKTRRALIILNLDPPVTVSDVKARYKELVKRHHPDANGGDKASEERFKEISEAYRTVMTTLAV